MKISKLIALFTLLSCKPHHDINHIIFCDLSDIKSWYDLLNSNINGNDSLWIKVSQNLSEQNYQGPKDSVLLKFADIFHGKAHVNLSLNNARARLFYRSALNLREKFYGTDVHLDKLRALISIGDSYLLDRYYLEALQYYDSADIDESQFKIFPYIYNKTKKGDVYFALNDPVKALDELMQAYNRVSSTIQEKDFEEQIAWKKASTKLYYLVSKLAEVLISKREYHKALEFAYGGFGLVRKWGPSQDSFFQLGNLFIISGMAFKDSADHLLNWPDKNKLYSEALNNYSKARSYNDQARNYQSVLVAMLNQSIIYELMNDFSNAEQISLEGIRLINTLNDPVLKTHLLSFYHVLTASYYWQNKLGLARETYRLALTHIDSQNATLNLLPRIDKFYSQYDHSLVFLGSIGRINLKLSFHDKHYMELANASYDSLFQLINYIRANLLGDNAKLSLAKHSRNWIPDAIEDIRTIYYMTDNPFYRERTFQLVEQAKAFSLLEVSRLNNASELLPKELITLQNELLRLQQLGLGNDSIRDLAERKQREFISELKIKAPSYFALKYKGIDLSVKQIQKDLLQPDQDLIEYFVDDSCLTIFRISHSDFILDTVNITKQKLSELIQSFEQNMNPVNPDGSISKERTKAFCTASSSLYEILIGKQNKLFQLPRRLIIIPDGELNNISFDALLTKVDGVGDNIPLQIENNNFCLQKYSISYCFSANLLFEMSKPKKNNELQSSLAIFAPEFHPESTTLPYMHYQKDEVDGIKACIKNCKTENNNTKSHFLRQSNKYAYLHLSTHGFVSEDPDKSYLAFSQKSSTVDTTQLFYLKELYNYKMNQELITLTACETALGQQREGEGNISLARGFAYAGVRSFITTLWKIQTNGAAKIIPGFYDRLFNKKLPKDVALAESKREFLRQGKSIYPENWAGLILIGNTENNFVTPSSINFLWYVIAILISSLIFRWIYKKYLNKST